MTKHLLMLVIAMLMPLTSQALLEARVGYGINTLDEDNYNGATLDTMTGYNLDLIIEPPLLTDLGLGVRYESMGLDVDMGGTNIGETKMKRVAALVNYRIIDLIAYLGVIGTVGVSTNLETQILGTTTKYDDRLNYSIGIEGGINLGIFSVGAELGKFFGKFKHSSGDVELDSIYMKALVGLDF